MSEQKVQVGDLFRFEYYGHIWCAVEFYYDEWKLRRLDRIHESIWTTEESLILSGDWTRLA